MLGQNLSELIYKRGEGEGEGEGGRKRNTCDKEAGSGVRLVMQRRPQMSCSGGAYMFSLERKRLCIIVQPLSFHGLLPCE